jgi:hypothetical protein
MEVLVAQPLAGAWEGFLRHTSCLGSEQHFRVRLQLHEGGSQDQYTGSIGYFLSFSNAPLEEQNPLFQFPVKASFDGYGLSFQYFATEELQSRQFTIGYYILGRYNIMLNYKRESNAEIMDGIYNGSNGGRGILKLRRRLPQTETAETTESIFAKLRQQQQMRKSIQQNKAPSTATVAKAPVWEQSDSLTQLYKLEQKTVAILNKRQDSTFKTIEVADSVAYLAIELYDNGEIDGDTVSVFVNDVLVLHRVRLGIEPVQYNLYKPVQGNRAKVRVVAENLGSIPPNTALAQIKTPSGMQRFLMKSDERSNGVIVFQWNE